MFFVEKTGSSKDEGEILLFEALEIKKMKAVFRRSSFLKKISFKNDAKIDTNKIKSFNSRNLHFTVPQFARRKGMGNKQAQMMMKKKVSPKEGNDEAEDEKGRKTGNSTPALNDMETEETMQDQIDEVTKKVNKAVSLMKRSKFDEALKEYEEAINVPVDFHTGGILMGMGICNVEIEDYASAIDCFKKALKYDHSNLSCYDSLAYSLYQVDREEEALEMYKKGLSMIEEIGENESEFVEFNFHIGQIYMDRGDNKEALKWFERGLVVDPTHGQLLHFKAVCLKNEGKLKEAKAIFLQAINKSDYPFPDTFYFLHKIYEAEGDQEKSNKFLQEHLEYQERLKAQDIEYQFDN